MVEKETSFEKIKRLITNQQNIRNVATSAHIHHGKCIGGSSRVMLADGSIQTAREIFEEVIKDGKIHEENDDHVVYTPSRQVEIFSLNKEARKIEIKHIQYAWRLKGGNTIKIALRNGFSITTTPEHKYLVYKDGLKYVQAEDLKLGDIIVCTRKVNAKTNDTIKKEILERLSEKNFYVKLEDSFAISLKDKILHYGIKNIPVKSSISHKSFYHGMWRNRYHLADLLEICRIFGIEVEEIYDHIHLIFFRAGKQRGHNSLPMKLPQDFEALFYLAGLFIGDGSGKKFIAGKEDLAKKVYSLCTDLNVKTINVSQKDRTPEVHTTRTLVEILNSLFAYPLRKKSHNVRVSDFLCRRNDTLIAKFIRGYFDTDGCVEKSRSAITISSASSQMISDLHLLLLRLGCVAIREKDNTLALSGMSAINFSQKVGFGLKEKAERMIINNTAFTDNLLAAAGMMATKNAGNLDEGMTTWQHADEQERLMTVDAANVSMAHEYQGKEYLINLIDTPGHVDFGGNVTRAMRAIDGTFVLVCAVEGIMPQTETVLKQALRERVKQVLFINKVDRLIKELKVTPEQMQERFAKIISEFNALILQIAEPDLAEKWKVNVLEGSVAFGSARENWALSVQFMKKRNISFSDIIKIYDMEETERKDWVWKNAPLNEVVLDMAVKHLPNPLESQKYRIPKIWRGDLDSKLGQDLLTCNPNGELAFVVTRIVIDPRSGKEICAGRLYSGTMKNGMEVYCNLNKKKARIQQVLVYNGIKPEQLESVPAGNVLAISGINVDVGETITDFEQTPFEELKHIFQPVITKSIEVIKPQDLPKLIEVLRKVGKEDPSVKIEINEETGENLLSGMGELHLEIIEGRIKTEKGLEVKMGNPIIVYRETINKASGEIESRTPNGHNILFFSMEPLEDSVYNAIEQGVLSEGRLKKKAEEVW